MQPTTAAADQGLMLGPGEGRVVRALGLTITVRAGGADTGGAYLAFEFPLEPGQAVPPHVHPVEESIYVLEGEIASRIGDRTVTAPAGSFCVVPRGVVHGQTNRGAEPARLLIVLSPPTLEGLLYELDGRPTEQAIEAMREHGMVLAG